MAKSNRSESLMEGYAYDRATGKPVNLGKPEEAVRQEEEKILEEDYGYSLKQMDIEVPIVHGSREKPTKNDWADIAIYNTEDPLKRDQNLDILGIVETKRPNRESGVRQLMSYMSASSALWGIWTNGKEIEYLYKNPSTGEIKRNFVYQIPKSGESFEDIGKITKASLQPAKNLTVSFRRILGTLYTNTNISRREKLGAEMIRLIFCKIWDERYDQHLPPKFIVGFKDNPESVKKKVEKLFDQVKEELVEDGVFDDSEKINLDAKSVAYVVGELERFALLKTDRDVVGDAFEVFAEGRLVGEKGEFFTPRPVVKTCIEIVNPQPQKKIADPACGSGGFLIYALEHVWNEMEKNRHYSSGGNIEQLKKEFARKYFFGIDKEMDLVKISKAYMAIVGDGRGGIVQQNTLHKPEEYEGKAKEFFVDSQNHFKKFDIILTNPPFGSKIPVLEEEAASFELGHVWKKKNEQWIKTDETKDTPPQELFVERCLELLVNGGTLGIVLPETYFHAPRQGYVLDYLRKGNNIKAIVDLAHNTFRPYNNAKTLLLVLEKGVPQQKKIIMAVAEQIGHDHNGKPMYRYDEEKKKFTDQIWDDTEIIRKELKDPANPSNQNVFVVPISEIKNNVFVPRYYWKRRIEKIKSRVARLGLDVISVKKLVDEGVIQHFSGHGSPPAKFKGKGTIPYIKVADISNWDIFKDQTNLIPEDIYKSKKGNGVNLQKEDVLFIRRGSYRIGSVAMISSFDIKVLLTKEISVFRVLNKQNPYGITPYYLLYLFSHELTQKQLYNKVFIDTTLPTLGDRWQELLLPLDPKQSESISKRVEDLFSKKWFALDEIEKLKEDFGNLIT